MNGTLMDRLRQIITTSGMSQSALARLAGVPQPKLNRFVNGYADITPKTMEKILNALGIRVVFEKKSD